MKFHHLGQLLLDTNCLLLVMKMFGMQDVSMTVVSKADSPDNKYACYHILLHYISIVIFDRQASSDTAFSTSRRTPN